MENNIRTTNWYIHGQARELTQATNKTNENHQENMDNTEEKDKETIDELIGITVENEESDIRFISLAGKDGNNPSVSWLIEIPIGMSLLKYFHLTLIVITSNFCTVFLSILHVRVLATLAY